MLTCGRSLRRARRWMDSRLREQLTRARQPSAASAQRSARHDRQVIDDVCDGVYYDLELSTHIAGEAITLDGRRDRFEATELSVQPSGGRCCPDGQRSGTVSGWSTVQASAASSVSRAGQETAEGAWTSGSQPGLT